MPADSKTEQEETGYRGSYNRRLIEASLDPFVTISPDGTISDVNEATIRVTGVPREELIGTDFSTYFKDPEKAKTGYETVFRDGSVTDYELEIRHRDGRTVPVLYNATVFRDEAGEVAGVFAAARDITERKRAEEALRTAYNELDERVKERTADLVEANLNLEKEMLEHKATASELEKKSRKLERSNEELQRFAYVASHDLQEPLRSIVLFSQLLEERYRGRLDADADEFIGYITEGGRRMQTLIQDLLRLSRLETEARPPAPTDTRGVMAGALRVLEPSIREAGATVSVGDLPAVLADAAQLELVFTNLVGNAVKYRRPGVPPEVRISSRRENGWWEFAVADNGIGIEAEYYGQIFEMFQRLHAKDEYDGTGIGLAVVKKIVERHGGTVRVESTPGEGSTFFFTLPAP